MPTGTVLGKGIRQTVGWPASAVKQIVLHSDWEGVQKTPPVVQVRIMHMGSQPFDAGQIKVDETSVTTITNDTDCNGCSFTRIDDGPATVAFHTNP